MLQLRMIAVITAVTFLFVFSPTDVHAARLSGLLPILQGATDETSTQIAVSVPSGSQYKMILVDGSKLIEPSSRREHSRPFSRHAVVQVEFHGLSSAKHYGFEVRNENGLLVDHRTLRTLDVRPHPVRIAIVSCMNDAFAEAGAPLWVDLLRQRPDMIFFVGDNVYADGGPFLPAGPERLWKRYAETRERLAIFQSTELVPIVATWDDHDYGANDGDFGYPHKEAAKAVFEAFFPQIEGAGSVQRGPGVSMRLALFGQRFYFMDARTFRNQRDRTGIVTHWGNEQSKWLRQQLRIGTGPIWLINGSQFFGAYHPFESFEREHPADLRRWLNELGQLPWPTLFVSGDRHLSEILNVERQEIPYKTYELTSSGIHSYISSKPEPRTLPRMGRTAGPFEEMNYMIVDTAFRATGRPLMRLEVSAIGLRQRVGFRNQLEVQR